MSPTEELHALAAQVENCYGSLRVKCEVCEETHIVNVSKITN